jgi:hypothetical protein
VSLLKNKMVKRTLSRRAVLRGAGVALALPWLESLAPRTAGAQAVAPAIRFLPVYLPNGATDLWMPQGAGAAWSLSSVLDPFQDLKAKMSVITNLENGSSFNADGSNSVEPSHGKQPGAWLTCVNFETIQKRLAVAEANGVSVDQIMAAHTAFKGKTPLPSLQVGLSTVHSFCDGQQCSNSRSVSWRTQTQPLYKMVDPLAVFNAITSVLVPSDVSAEELAKRIALKKSVLDNVLDNANETRGLLSTADQQRMDEFLESVRAVETRVTSVSGGMGGVACQPIAKPTMTTVSEDGIKQNTATYNKGTHADVMNDLIVMAFQCDVTRIITYMLEDERSEFVYDHVPRQKFTATSAEPGVGMCGEYHASQHVAADEFATITWYNVGKTAELCRKLDAIEEAEGRSILDNSVVLFGGAMHGEDHKCDRLPIALIGSGGGKLKTDQHVVYEKRPLRDLHFTLMNQVYGLGATDFGESPAGTPVGTLPEILAT